MKGLKKVALVSAIAAVSAGAQAELKALDDSVMGEMTGQAGLTIDVETQWSIGEFAYHDAGVLVIQDIAMGGNSNDASIYNATNANGSMLDNFRMTIDIAGSGLDASGNANDDNNFVYGFGEVRGLAAIHANSSNADTNFQAVMAGTDVDNGLKVDYKKAVGDGDLVIHFGFSDAWQKGGGFAAYAAGSGAAGLNADGSHIAGSESLTSATYAMAKSVALNAVDYQFDIGMIGLADSGYVDAGRLGSKALTATNHSTGLDVDASGTATTTLISDISFKGYLGPADLHIENNGNGFSGGPNGAGSGDADSKIFWDSFFKVTDLDLYIDIAGVQISDIKIHNVRGDLSSLNTSFSQDASGNISVGASSAFGFAHSKREIYAVKDAVFNSSTLAQLGGAPTGANTAGYVDGIALNTEFKGDIDIGHLSFGDTGTSIGEIYLTDVYSDTNWTISAH